MIYGSPTGKLGNYAFGLVVPGHDTFYLPDSTRPSGGVGSPRNQTLTQPPLSEVTIVIGDRKRKVANFVLSGTYKGSTEEDARLWGAALDDAAAAATSLVRSASVTRAIHLGSSLEWPDATKPHIRPFTLTFLPKGPVWLDANGKPMPF
jgi:hypothetical protein